MMELATNLTILWQTNKNNTDGLTYLLSTNDRNSALAFHTNPNFKLQIQANSLTAQRATKLHYSMLKNWMMTKFTLVIGGKASAQLSNKSKKIQKKTKIYF